MGGSRVTGPERVLNWTAVSHQLGWLWPLHFIGFGCAFFGLALFSLVCLCRIIHTSRRPLKRYFITVCVLLFFLSLTRSTYLLLDPYGSKAMVDLPAVVETFLSGVAYPFITSSFTLVFLSLLEATKLKLFPQKILSCWVVVAITVVQCSTVGIMDIMSLMCPSAKTVAVFCRAVFIVWGVVLFVTYLYTGVAAFSKHPNKLDLQPATCNCKAKKIRLRSRQLIVTVAKCTGAAAFLGLGLCFLQAYSLVKIYTSLKLKETESNRFEIWTWLGTATCSRLIEIVMSCLLCSVIYIPASRLNTKQRSFKVTRV